MSAAKPDERLEFLEGGPKLVPLVFAPGAEITILLRVRLGDHIFESSDIKDPLRIRIEATNQGFSYIAGIGKLELAGKTSQFPLAPHETALVGGLQGSSPRGVDPKPVVEATVKAIYIQFAPRTRAEAGAKAERIVEQIKRGADFTSLAQQNSDDPISATAGGTFGVFRSSDSLPPNIKAVIFTLKPGQVSDIVERPNGFYIFRLESLRQSDQ